MNGYVNKHNCHLWDNANPHEVHQVTMHPQKVTVWCQFWAGSINGPYFFGNDIGEAITINGERYRMMITDFFWSKMNNMDVDDVVTAGWRYVSNSGCYDGHSA